MRKDGFDCSGKSRWYPRVAKKAVARFLVRDDWDLRSVETVEMKTSGCALGTF